MTVARKRIFAVKDTNYPAVSKEDLIKISGLARAWD
jgi:hypothetical protein